MHGVVERLRKLLFPFKRCASAVMVRYTMDLEAVTCAIWNEVDGQN